MNKELGFSTTIGLGKIMPETQMYKGKSDKKKYYVYEWYICETGESFYIGKGTGQRDVQSKNEIFDEMLQKYNCKMRHLADNLTEDDAFRIESEEIKNKIENGNILINRQVPYDLKNGFSFHDPQNLYTTRYGDIDYKYLQKPPLLITEIDHHYFPDKKHEFYHYDKIDNEKIKMASFKADKMPQQVLNNGKIKSYTWFYDQVEYFEKKIDCKIKNIGGKTYKSIAKSSKCIIVLTDMMEYNFIKFHKLGKDVYHLSDVLKYFNIYDEEF